jgi:ABC-type lipoprotein release transport system permease subunit
MIACNLRSEYHYFQLNILRMIFWALRQDIWMAWRLWRSQKKSFGRALGWVASGVLSLGLASLLLVISLMEGVEQKLIEHTLSSRGHIRILHTQHPQDLFPETWKKEILEKNIIASIPWQEEETLMVLPAFGFFIIRKWPWKHIQQDLHITWEKDIKNKEFLQEYQELEISTKNYNALTENSLTLKNKVSKDDDPMISSRQKSRPCVLSESILKQYHLFLGEHVFTYDFKNVQDWMRRRHSEPNLELPPPQKMHIVGSVKEQSFLPLMWCGLTNLETEHMKANPTQGEKKGWDIFLAHPQNAETLSQQFMEENPSILCESWQNEADSNLAWVKTQKRLMIIIISIIVLSSAAMIWAMMLVFISQKNKVMAVLSELGLEPFRLWRILFFSGHMVIGTGLMLGTFLGCMISWKFAWIQHILEHIMGQPLFPESAFIFSEMPTYLSWTSGLWVILGSWFVAAIACGFPAYKASMIYSGDILFEAS